MKKMTTALFALGFLVLLAGIIGTTYETDVNAKVAINENFNSASQMSRWNNDSYNGMMGIQDNNYDNEDYSNLEKQDVEVLEEKVNDYINNIDENLEIADIFIFSDSDYYYSIVEKDTGMGAMELLVNPYTGIVYPEYGPNMMWNLKYGMMGNNNMMGYAGMMGNGNTSGYGGMMGNGNTSGYSRMMGNGNTSGYGGMMSNQNVNGQWCDSYESSDYTVGTEVKSNELSYDEAFNKASEFISGQVEDNYVGDSYHEFYGYFTFHVENNNNPRGMLSVNAFTGEVWFHDWHGDLIEILGNHEENEF